MVLCIFSLSAQPAMGYDATYKTYLAGISHIDTAWNWQIPETVDVVRQTWSDAVELIDQNPDTYKFNGGAAQHYAWMKEYHPALFAQIQQKYKEGKWGLGAGSWVEGDLLISSGESLTRQFLYGQKFFEKEFGETSDICFFPDSFGHGWKVPQIAKKSGMEYYMTSYYRAAHAPDDLFHWKGVDGTDILTLRTINHYDEGISEQNVQRALGAPNAMGIKKGTYSTGKGDHGGGPTQADIDKALALQSGVDAPDIQFSKLSDYFQELTQEEEKKITVSLDRDLKIDEFGQGGWTTQAATKLYHRKSLAAAEAAEKLSSIAMWMGMASYPIDTLRKAWEKTLVNEFHDLLGGCSINGAHEDSWNDAGIALNLFKNSTDYAAGAVASLADTRGRGMPVIIYNPLSHERNDIVETEIEFDALPVGVRVFDDKGKEIPSQIAHIRGNKVGLVFIAKDVPSLGYKVYHVSAASKPGKYQTGLTAADNILESSRFRVEINAKTGYIKRIFDKSLQKEILKEGKEVEFHIMMDLENAWKLNPQQVMFMPDVVGGSPEIQLVEAGPVRCVYKVSRRHNSSQYTQYITLYSDLDRVDIPTEIHWKESKKLLKVAFPFSFAAKETTYDLSNGTMTRTKNTGRENYEQNAHAWADMTDASGTFGVSILNDSKYGWDMPINGMLRLSLLRGARDQDGFADIGTHTMNYAIYPHAGDWKAGNTPDKGDDFNIPLIAYPTQSHKGELGKTFSFVSVNRPNITVRAVKRAEDSDDLIVRLYETHGAEETPVELTFAESLESAAETNLLEEEIGTAKYKGRQLTTTLAKYEIKTFRIRLPAGKRKDAEKLIQQVPLETYYTLDGVSSDSNRKDGNLDGAGNTLSAELLSAQEEISDIPFQLGPTAEGQKNFVQAQGQTLSLPAGKYDRLFLLGFSAGKGASSGMFTVKYRGGSKTETGIAFRGWTDLMGSWKQEETRDVLAVPLSHYHMPAGDQVEYSNQMYLYSIHLNNRQTVESITLPKAEGIRIAAMTLAAGNSLPQTYTDYKGENLALGKPAKASDQSIGEAANAVDGTVGEGSRWGTRTLGDRWLEIDLGTAQKINRWVVKNAGAGNESTQFNLSAYKLQKSDDGEVWTDVDGVGNQMNVTDRMVDEFSARYVRLVVGLGQQQGNESARVYELELYHTPQELMPASVLRSVPGSNNTGVVNSSGTGLLGGWSLLVVGLICLIGTSAGTTIVLRRRNRQRQDQGQV